MWYWRVCRSYQWSTAWASYSSGSPRWRERVRPSASQWCGWASRSTCHESWALPTRTWTNLRSSCSCAWSNGVRLIYYVAQSREWVSPARIPSDARLRGHSTWSAHPAPNEVVPPPGWAPPSHRWIRLAPSTWSWIYPTGYDHGTRSATTAVPGSASTAPSSSPYPSAFRSSGPLCCFLISCTASLVLRYPTTTTVRGPTSLLGVIVATHYPSTPTVVTTVVVW